MQNKSNLHFILFLQRYSYFIIGILFVSVILTLSGFLKFVSFFLIIIGTVSYFILLNILEVIKEYLKNLNEMKERFSTWFNASPYAVAITRKNDGVFTEVNSALCKMFGLDKEMIIGKKGIDLNLWVNPLDRKRMLEMLADKGEVNKEEIKLKRKDGAVLICSVSLRQIQIENEEYLMYLTDDITRRKNDEMLIRENSVKLEMALMSANMGTWYHDFTGNKRYMDENSCKLLGNCGVSCESSEEDFFKIVHPEDRVIITNAMKKNFRG